jgi:transcriptional regulator GlxA family with amidase domain
MRLLSSNQRFTSVAAAAAAAGFSDHAHMTRSYRAMLGRLPSEFTEPPDVVAPWAGV